MARIFNTYGPRMHHADGRVVSNFIVQALSGAPLTIYGTGSHTRAFCYVSDLVDGLVRLMGSDDDVTGPVNLGNPQEFTILDLAQQIIAMTGSASELVFMPLPADDPKQRRPEIARARTILSWQPEVPLHAGLRQTVSYFERLLPELHRS